MNFDPCCIFGKCLCYDVVDLEDTTDNNFLPRVPRSNPLCCESILEVAAASHSQMQTFTLNDERTDILAPGAIQPRSPALAPSDSVAKLIRLPHPQFSSPLQNNAGLTLDAQRLLLAIQLLVDSGLASSNHDSTIDQSLQSDLDQHIDSQQHEAQVAHSISSTQSMMIAPRVDHQQQFVDPKLLIIAIPESTTNIQMANQDHSWYDKSDRFGLYNREPKQPLQSKFDQSLKTGKISSPDTDVERNNHHVRNTSRSADRQVPSSDSRRSVSGTGKHAKSQEPYGHSSGAAFKASSTSALLSTPPPSTLSTPSGKRKRLDEAEHSPPESSTSAVSADCNPSPSLSPPSPSPPPLKRHRLDDMTPSLPMPTTPGDLPMMQGPSQGQENLGPELHIVFEDPSIVPRAKDNFRPSKYQDLI